MTLPLIVALPDVAYNIEWDPSGGFAEFQGPRVQLGATTFAALDGGRIVGVLVVSFHAASRVMRAKGTLVLPRYRRAGLALRLWGKAIRTLRPAVVSVAVVSDRGRTLIESVMAEHRGIAWTVHQDGARPLRNLRRKGRAA